MGHRRRRARSLGIAIAALALALATPALAQARERAKDLGPTPVNSDCLVYRGGNPCYYNLWTSIFQVDRHIVAPGEILSAQVAVIAGLTTGYFWAEPGGAGLKKIFCPQTPPKVRTPGKPLRFNSTCTWRATAPTKAWVVFGPTLTLVGSNPYQDGDYYAVVSGAAVHGRILDDEGHPVGGVRVLIDGPEDVFAVTDAQGTYEAIELQRGSYTVRLAGKGCVDDGRTTVTSKSCKASKSVKLGTEEVNFRILDRYAIEGKVRDEFKRGVAGVLVDVKTPKGDKIQTRTDRNGTYHVGLEAAGAYDLAVTGEGRGAREVYYIVRGGKPTTGISASVRLSRATKRVPVDWELDRQLQFSVQPYTDGVESRYATFTADGASRGGVEVTVKTMHGDPVPDGVAIHVRPSPAEYPRTIICSSDPVKSYTIRWPGIVGGKPDRTGWTERTDDDGMIAFDFWGGTDNGMLPVNFYRESDPKNSTYDIAVAFSAPAAKAMPDGKGLQKLLFDALRLGSSSDGMSFSDAQGVLEWLIDRRKHYTDMQGYDFAPVVSSRGRTGVAIFPVGSPPAEGPIGELSGANVRIWDIKNTNVFAGDALPTLEEWRTGSGLAAADGITEAGALQVGFRYGVRRDPRTYLGWPLPVRGSSIGNCIWGVDKDPAAAEGWSEWVFGVHSPVRVTLTGAGGKRLGILPSGKPIAQLPGMVWKSGETTWYAVPAGKYKLSVVGSGSGLATLEARTTAGVTTAQFSARKGTKTSFALKSKGQLPAFRYGKQKVSPRSGRSMTVIGLPKRLRHDRGVKLRVQVVDVEHKGIPFVWMTYEIGDQRWSVQSDAEGKIDTLLPAVEERSLQLVFRADRSLNKRAAIKIPVR